MDAIRHLRELAGNRPLAALTVANAVSGAGDWLYFTALPVLVYQMTGDPLLIAVVVAARLIPLFTLSIPAGILADRVSPRSILIATEAISATALIGIATLASAGAPLAPVAVLAIIASSAGTVAQPARSTLIPVLARNDDELGRANALYTTLDAIGSVVGPAIAGVLIVIGGLGAAFLVDGLTFALVAVVLVRSVPAARPATAPTETTGDDASVIADLPWSAIAARIWHALALDGAISFASVAMATLTVVIAVEHLHEGAEVAGVINAVGGVAAIVGGLLTGFLINRDVRIGAAIGTATAAIALGLVAVASAPLAVVVLLAVTTGAMIMLDTLNSTNVQRLSADGFTGRAFGLLHSLAALWMIAGTVLPALVASTFGVGAALGLTAAVVAVLGGIALVRPRTRQQAYPVPALAPAD